MICEKLRISADSGCLLQPQQLLWCRFTLHKVPEKYMDFTATASRIVVDCRGWSKKFFLEYAPPTPHAALKPCPKPSTSSNFPPTAKCATRMRRSTHTSARATFVALRTNTTHRVTMHLIHNSDRIFFLSTVCNILMASRWTAKQLMPSSKMEYSRRRCPLSTARP